MEKAFFVYAWDLIAEGPENALGKIQELGAKYHLPGLELPCRKIYQTTCRLR